MNPMAETVVRNAAKLIAEATIKMNRDGKTLLSSWNCNNPGTSNVTRDDFEYYVKTEVNERSKYLVQKDKYQMPLLMPPIEMNVKTENKSTSIDVGSWKPKDGFVLAPGFKMEKVKRFFRVGVVLGQPWAWVKDAEDPIDFKALNESMPNRGLTGYCIELLEKVQYDLTRKIPSTLVRFQLATRMDFEYEIVLATNNLYGHKQENGTWSGIVGDLISGDIDISVATLTMTTEREEVIDFVAPYFDQVRVHKPLDLIKNL